MSPFSRFALYYLAVVRSGSLRKAAERLHISASAINRQILQAEASFGTPLFERLADGLRMTTAGELLYADLLRWQREFEVTKQRFDEIQGLQRGKVKIGLVQALNQGEIADCLARLVEQYPSLTLEIVIESSKAIGEQLRTANLDVGLLLDPGEVSGLEVRSFCELDVGVALSPRHPLAAKKTLRLSELHGQRHILPGENLVVHERVIALYQRAALSVENTIICNDIALIRHFVTKDSGIALLCQLDVQREIEEGSLVFIPLHNNRTLPLTLALCVAPSRQLSRAALRVIQQLSESIEIIATK
ncbi:LysR family transcriptional regulator [Rosenbergiella collisarenosi]|uniref:LysR family transcriptional regulator n=1 Tax=Rosenbergiella collisarenosi TaxID=1544695 RepID=UPI001BDB008D|nr:LysR family transcriptional regulator [Rosenbergiella collisarenosi]MBT0721203.1 LysR family transcriptional regulator [Rosenbergiella collisarenosi]